MWHCCLALGPTRANGREPGNKKKSSNSYNRDDEDFSAVDMEAFGKKKLAASTQRHMVVTSLGLRSHRIKKWGWENTVSSADTRSCPDRDTPHTVTVSSYAILKAGGLMS